jgi:hypothetical protein
MPKVTKPKRHKHSTETCCICLETISKQHITRITSCRHRYHYNCIKRWSQRENSCPLCKRNFNWIKKGKRRERVTRRTQGEGSDNRVIQSILWHFYNTPNFRDLIGTGLQTGCDFATRLFTIIKGVVGIIRERDLQVLVDRRLQREAYVWLDAR